MTGGAPSKSRPTTHRDIRHSPLKGPTLAALAELAKCGAMVHIITSYDLGFIWPDSPCTVPSVVKCKNRVFVERRIFHNALFSRREMGIFVDICKFLGQTASEECKS